MRNYSEIQGLGLLLVIGLLMGIMGYGKREIKIRGNK